MLNLKLLVCSPSRQYRAGPQTYSFKVNMTLETGNGRFRFNAVPEVYTQFTGNILCQLLTVPQLAIMS